PPKWRYCKTPRRLVSCPLRMPAAASRSAGSRPMNSGKLKSACTVSQHTNPMRKRGRLFDTGIPSLTLRVGAADSRTVILVLEAPAVRPPRFERGTYGLEVRCSVQLSYG